MTTHNSQTERPAEKLLDLLLDALHERQATRQAGQAAAAEALLDDETLPIPSEALREGLAVAPQKDTPTQAYPQQDTREAVTTPRGECGEPFVEDSETAPTPEHPYEADAGLPGSAPVAHLARTTRSLILAVVLLVVLINIPINRYGTSLARIVPDAASLVLRDGLVLKAAGPDIYVLQDNRLRWISSLDAFEYFGYRWDQVHVVDDHFLQQFELGRPLHVLLKCDASPHIYALENGKKRWIRDIATFESEGYIWSDVKSVDCRYLSALADGTSIPEAAGPPPQP